MRCRSLVLICLVALAGCLQPPWALAQDNYFITSGQGRGGVEGARQAAVNAQTNQYIVSHEASITSLSSDVTTLNNSLSSTITQTNSNTLALAPFSSCAALGAPGHIYVPGHASADGNGCVNSSTMGSSGGTLRGRQAFFTSGTWTPPSGVSTASVIVIGPGGGSGWTAGTVCGGQGGLAIANVTGISGPVAVTIGTPGANTACGQAGTSSSFGTYVTAGAGLTPKATANCPNLASGAGTVTLGGGATEVYSGYPGTHQAGVYAHMATSYYPYGAGGQGQDDGNCYKGGPGLVVVEWLY